MVIGQRLNYNRLSDAELVRFVKAARHMTTPEANIGKPPREQFVVQLSGASAEWRRRHSIVEGSENYPSAVSAVSTE